MMECSVEAERWWMELPTWRVDATSLCSVVRETAWCRQLRRTETAQVVGIGAVQAAQANRDGSGG
jgi:hypothetical protein